MIRYLNTINSDAPIQIPQIGIGEILTVSLESVSVLIEPFPYHTCVCVHYFVFWYRNSSASKLQVILFLMILLLVYSKSYLFDNLKSMDLYRYRS